MIYPRDIQNKLKVALNNNKIIIMTGARQVGKTTLLKRCKSYIENNGYQTEYLTLDDPLVRSSLDTHPENLFQYTSISNKSAILYIFIDEIQYLKDPTGFLKYIYDQYKESIRLVVTGSSSFYIDSNFRDSLAGRKTLIPVYPLSFGEYLVFHDQSTLLSEVSQGSYSKKNKMMQYAYDYLIYGGYPECVLLSTQIKKQEYLKQLVQSYVSKDIDEAGVEFRQKYLILMKIMASQIGNLVNKAELGNTLDLSAPIVHKYLHVMQKSYHLGLISPWFGNNIRNELIKMPKVYFFDNGLRNALIGNWEQRDQRIDCGALLENTFFGQIIHQVNLDEIMFWRSKQQHEIDFVISGSQAYEIKQNKLKINHVIIDHFHKYYPTIPVTCYNLHDILLHS